MINKKKQTGKKYSVKKSRPGKKENRYNKEYAAEKGFKEIRDLPDSRDIKSKKKSEDKKDGKVKRKYPVIEKHRDRKDYSGSGRRKASKDVKKKKPFPKTTSVTSDAAGVSSGNAGSAYTENKGLVRLNKFIAANGISSRRKVDEMILEERVTVNGNTVNELGFRIDPGFDKVRVDGELVRTDTKKVYIILNKPKGIITSVKDEKKRTTVIDLIKLNQKIFPVGRLDYNTSGLLLLTNDGGFANYLMSPKNKVHKTYYVQLSKPLEEKHRVKLSEGIKLDGILTAPAKIKYLKNNDYQRLFISIYEGKNRQIHNMFEHFGYFVRELMRVEYGGLKLEGLKEGSWRFLNAVEVSKLKPE
ncbi:MAG: rRNA pseudouridine synthase [Bacteroidetes bacterium]|nr:rRNA pseudouridine synthase [Bacteroidota bacterium]